MSANRVNRAKFAKCDEISTDQSAVESNEDSLVVIAERLDFLRSATNDALGAIVVGAGSCMARTSDGDLPGWLFDSATPESVAARLCGTCPVRDECLELELRLFRDQKLGMWGALGESGRCAVYPVWSQRRDGEAGSDSDAMGGGAR
ncbi:WhiB family transcriptional regulator [Pseudonocardia alaniniphila]|uniref:WhiB family transcriptional regulator n=1 Tax=Pseudonocardia alaniniphila TaxID=75291 RepID=A0ABS9T9R8_9PSEU|nr:WhiB family transcriptional regulator [Pseudonocardia alaniniphila]MCH6165163.1 WhiB family transcriptional regulator [Pseudonocardia alaniniphila]